MAKKTTAYIGLGSNLGDRRGYISKALENLASSEQIRVLKTASLTETEPVGMTGGAAFLNTVTEVETGLSAYQLLERLEQIEGTLGRESKGEKKNRTIDLDLLLFGEQVIDSKDLAVPHPEMHLRSFVLKGLCELSPDLEHPVLAEPCIQLLRRLGGNDYEFPPDYPRLVSIAGVIGVGKTTLTERLCELTGYQPIYECYGENPFLPEVFTGNRQLALDSQLFFLVSRLQQLNRGTLEEKDGWISDYIFEKEMIYAEKFLDDTQLDLYKKIHSFSNSAAQPRLVIYLADTVDNCLARIHKRGRNYEQGIKPQLLEELTESYNRLFGNWDKCPVITLHLDEMDITDNRFAERLAAQVQYYLR